VQGKVDTPNRRLADIAARQHGVVTIRQLRGAGVSDDAVRWRVRSGLLHRLHRGVYALGHPGLADAGRWMAAVLALGDGAVLSHGSAAALWGLLRPLDGPVDVSIPSRNGRSHRSGVRLHRCPSLTRTQRPATTRHRGIPVTTPARTVADLPQVLPPRLVRRATRQAELLGLPLGETASDGTRSDLERDFLRLCRGHGLPRPEVNVGVGRWTVDFLWPDCRLVVETDGYLYHRGRIAFEDDHERDLGLRELGYDVLRLSEGQIAEGDERIAELLVEALGG
jgi:very-short-patch-repair endonuclease